MQMAADLTLNSCDFGAKARITDNDLGGIEPVQARLGTTSMSMDHVEYEKLMDFHKRMD